MQSSETAPRVAIACGGTGGHLFPGLAVADLLIRSGCAVQLLISSKEVDRQAVGSAERMEVVALPAVGLDRRNPAAFFLGLWRSYRLVRSVFHRRQPAAVLAMGGFTGVAPVLAGRQTGASLFLHESNSIPGGANRRLAPWVDHVFVGFPGAARRLRNHRVTFTGTPVRGGIGSKNSAACRSSIGFRPDQPLLLIVGGSQGASAINDLLLASLPMLAGRHPTLQLLHLTGPCDFEKVSAAYAAQALKAVVRPFFQDMADALGAATVAISRAGASSLAEFAAARLPAVLIPFPAAADNHQFFNAQALVESGAARLLEQQHATPERLASALDDLLVDSIQRDSMQSALSRWHHPDAAQQIVTQIMAAVEQKGRSAPRSRHVPVSSAAMPSGSGRDETRNLASA